MINFFTTSIMVILFASIGFAVTRELYATVFFVSIPTLVFLKFLTDKNFRNIVSKYI